MPATGDSDGCAEILRTCFEIAAPASVAVLGNLRPLLPCHNDSIIRQGDEPDQLKLDGVTALIITDALDSMTDEQVTKTLAALRNKLLPNIAWMCPTGRASGIETTLLSIGFSAAGEFSARVLFRYAIADADTLRDWNNADNWARPENFRKHRW